MQITRKLILSLSFIILVVAFGFAFWQAGQEEFRLRNDLEKRSSILVDSLQESVISLLEGNNSKSLVRLVNKFSNREKILGISIHNMDGTLLVASSGLDPQVKKFPRVIDKNLRKVEKLNEEHGEYFKMNEVSVHAYSVPLAITENAQYLMTLFHDRGYIRERVNTIWINTFIRALLQAFLMALTTLIIIYLNVTSPIRKTTEWIKKIRRGEIHEDLSPENRELLGPLAHEITRMAKSLELSRLAVENEARLRLKGESLWTAESLKEFVTDKLQDRPLFVVSNREPCMHFKKGSDIEWIVPASGLVTAIEPVLKACGGTWIAQGAGDGDRETVDEYDRLMVPPDEPQYTLRRVWITKEEEEGYYYGFANEGLWPLCHIAHARPTFRSQNWEDYQTVNARFAEAVLEELEGVDEPFVLIQDYHFALLPNLIKAKRPDARVAIFWHIPWPNPESFSICPWQKELLQGMLGADLIGFHTQFHCNNFTEAVDRFLESRIDYEHFTVNREGHTTWIKPFPISIATHDDLRPEEEVSGEEAKANLLKPYGLEAEYLGVGVDRLDYTKGIAERFLAVENFLENSPEYVGKFTFVELGAPSRELIPKYQEFIAEIERETQRINDRFKTKNWQPILLLKKHHSHRDILPFYQYADVCMVTSLHDGMNLVAKEFVMVREDYQGVLILSQFTGAARELPDALIINPYDIAQTGEAISRALKMPQVEQEDRMRRMREVVEERNIYRWAAELVGELTHIRLDSQCHDSV